MQVDPQQPYGAPPPAQLDVGGALSYGFEAFKRYPGPLVLITLVFLVVSGAINGLGYAFQDIALLQLLLNLAGFVVSVLLYMGMVRVGLKVTAGEEPEVADLFKPDQLPAFLGAGILVAIAIAIGLLFCIIPGIYVGIMLGFFGFIVLARGAGAIDSISASAALTKDHRGTLFLLGLAIFGINLVGFLFFCGVGLLVTYPITTVAMAYAYRVLSGDPVASPETA